MIVQSAKPVILVGGAKVTAAQLDSVLTPKAPIVAADGGASMLLRLGHAPQAVIGDMDSLSPEARTAFADRLHHIAEQNSTDFDKTLRHIEAPLVLALGVSGGRFDHDLASMHVLLRYPERRCVIVREHSIVFLCPPVLNLRLDEGSPFSLFPFGPVGVVSEGLRWPTADIAFSPNDRIGTSNMVTGPVQLRADAPSMMVILPAEALAEVIQRLQDAARWPARAI